MKNFAKFLSTVQKIDSKLFKILAVLIVAIALILQGDFELLPELLKQL